MENQAPKATLQLADSRAFKRAMRTVRSLIKNPGAALVLKTCRLVADAGNPNRLEILATNGNRAFRTFVDADIDRPDGLDVPIPETAVEAIADWRHDDIEIHTGPETIFLGSAKLDQKLGPYEEPYSAIDTSAFRRIIKARNRAVAKATLERRKVLATLRKLPKQLPPMRYAISAHGVHVWTTRTPSIEAACKPSGELAASAWAKTEIVFRPEHQAMLRTMRDLQAETLTLEVPDGDSPIHIVGESTPEHVMIAVNRF